MSVKVTVYHNHRYTYLYKLFTNLYTSYTNVPDMDLMTSDGGRFYIHTLLGLVSPIVDNNSSLVSGL